LNFPKEYTKRGVLLETPRFAINEFRDLTLEVFIVTANPLLKILQNN